MAYYSIKGYRSRPLELLAIATGRARGGAVALFLTRELLAELRICELTQTFIVFETVQISRLRLPSLAKPRNEPKHKH